MKKSGFYTGSGFLKVGPRSIIRHLENEGFTDSEITHFTEEAGGGLLHPITVVSYPRIPISNHRGTRWLAVERGRSNIHSSVGPLAAHGTEAKNCCLSSSRSWRAADGLVGGFTVGEQWFM